MAEISARQGSAMRTLIDKYNLVATDGNSRDDDIFIKAGQYVLLKKSGIDKIRKVEKIETQLQIHSVGEDFCVMEGLFKMEGKEDFQTFASATRGNCQNKYYVEMAEKRVCARGVLQLIDAYNEGVMGSDEVGPGMDKESEPTTSKSYSKKDKGGSN